MHAIMPLNREAQPRPQADAAAGLPPASSGATFEGRISEFLA
jgi:hypothetical protein